MQRAVEMSKWEISGSWSLQIIIASFLLGVIIFILISKKTNDALCEDFFMTQLGVSRGNAPLQFKSKTNILADGRNFGALFYFPSEREFIKCYNTLKEKDNSLINNPVLIKDEFKEYFPNQKEYYNNKEGEYFYRDVSPIGESKRESRVGLFIIKSKRIVFINYFED